MKQRYVALCFSLIVTLLIGWLIWKSAAQTPLYSSQSHTHSDDDSHAHEHSHDGNLDHGHEHVGLLGETTHSHPHQHGHEHEVSQAVLDKGLSLVGHIHAGDEVTQFFAKAAIVDGDIQLDFYKHNAETLASADPANERFDAEVFNGTQFETSTTLESSETGFAGDLPTGFLCLPTHSIRIEGVIFSKQEFDAVIPLEPN